MRTLFHWTLVGAMSSTMFAPPIVAQSTRDSAGILIAENVRPAWTERERVQLADKPRLAIGNGTDSAYRFRQIRGVMRLADGRIAVTDGASLQLRLYDTAGRFVSKAAGKGTEPGQIMSMNWVRRLRGDSIAICTNLSTVVLYANSGQFVRTFELPPRLNAPSAPPQLLVALLNSKSGVSSSLPVTSTHSIGSRWRDSLTLNLVTEASDAPRTLGRFPFVEMVQENSGPSSVWLSSIGVFVGGDERFFVGFGDRYQIRAYDADGKLRSIIRRAWKSAPISSEDWEYWVVEWSKLWVRTTGAERERDIQKVREEPWAEESPAFSQFIPDRAGRLWVREAHWQDAIAAGSLSDPPAIPSSWSVFNERGRWLGDVSMPKGFQPFEIGSDYVIGTMRTDGVNQIVLFDMGARGR